jgi:hypothetical protein
MLRHHFGRRRRTTPVAYRRTFGAPNVVASNVVASVVPQAVPASTLASTPA